MNNQKLHIFIKKGMNYVDKVARNLVIVVFAVLFLLPCAITILVEQHRENENYRKTRRRIENLRYETENHKELDVNKKDICF